jgi:hypothetical protein
MMIARISHASLLGILLGGAYTPALPLPPVGQNSPAWEWRPVAAFGGPPLFFGAAFAIGERAYIVTGYGLVSARDRTLAIGRCGISGKPAFNGSLG